ncbi:MAG: lipoprotein-anchoring transpeptidase ErfK/SrfK [Cryomorphaceae bacterium]|jgi:lipoprotein-anchoring transpeptidase ErfK/SrfK
MNKPIFNLKQLLPFLTLVITATLTSCGSTGGPSKANPLATRPLNAVFVNPYEKGTYKHFKAGPNYPKTYNVFKNSSLLAKTNSENSNVVIDLGLQRAFLMHHDEVAMDYPVSTGNSKHPTPTGDFKIMEKVIDKRSNLYGKILDANGEVVKTNADSRDDVIPEGGSFLGASMTNWMRITGDGVGMHRGRVPRYPASHGCIRTPRSVVTIIYDKVKFGTSVTILK